MGALDRRKSKSLKGAGHLSPIFRRSGQDILCLLIQGVGWAPTQRALRECESTCGILKQLISFYTWFGALPTHVMEQCVVSGKLRVGVDDHFAFGNEVGLALKTPDVSGCCLCPR